MQWNNQVRHNPFSARFSKQKNIYNIGFLFENRYDLVCLSLYPAGHVRTYMLARMSRTIYYTIQYLISKVVHCYPSSAQLINSEHKFLAVTVNTASLWLYEQISRIYIQARIFVFIAAPCMRVWR